MAQPRRPGPAAGAGVEQWKGVADAANFSGSLTTNFEAHSFRIVGLRICAKVAGHTYTTSCHPRPRPLKELIRTV